MGVRYAGGYEGGWVGREKEGERGVDGGERDMLTRYRGDIGRSCILPFELE